MRRTKAQELERERIENTLADLARIDVRVQMVEIFLGSGGQAPAEPFVATQLEDLKATTARARQRLGQQWREWQARHGYHVRD